MGRRVGLGLDWDSWGMGFGVRGRRGEGKGEGVEHGYGALCGQVGDQKQLLALRCSLRGLTGKQRAKDSARIRGIMVLCTSRLAKPSISRATKYYTAQPIYSPASICGIKCSPVYAAQFLQFSYTVDGTSSFLISSGRSRMLAYKPAERCHAIWQWKGQTPGLSDCHWTTCVRWVSLTFFSPVGAVARQQLQWTGRARDDLPYNPSRA